ncbi:hypothetical protein AS361_03755 [Myroides marinus]|uniref:hypothetical protein n=1 Tax=Myroides marinus TaxID=703342 RepID=UPI0007422AF7|nr:hypothetical protein [Myroides marinus]KUF38972.1 hypothetical protein AS361_03755 [Myroides marinus]
MAGNSSSVYATSRPSGFNIADTIVQQEQINMARQDQKRREQQLEEQRKEKLFERDEKLRERLLTVPQNYDTGSGSLNELQGRIIMQAVNRKGEIYNLLRNGKINDQERIKLEIENKNLDNLPANLKVATQNFTKIIDDYKKGTSEGSFFKNIDFEQKVLNGFDNYLGSVDENGFPLIGFKDVNGDGKMDLMPWDNLKEGVGVWNFQPKLSLDKMINESTKYLGTEEKKTVSGYIEKTTKGVPLDVAQQVAKGLIYDTDGKFKDVVYSYLRENDMNYISPTAEDVKKIEQYTVDRILNSKDKKDITEKNFSAENSAADRAQRERHFRASQVKEEKSGLGEAVEPTKATWGSHYKELAKDVRSIPITGKVSLDAVSVKEQGKNKTYSNVTVDNYSYTKDGKMVISGSYPEGKTTKSLNVGTNAWSDDKVTVAENKKMKTIVSKETESRIAKMLNTTTDELKQRANYTSKNMSNELPNYNDELPDF